MPPLGLLTVAGMFPRDGFELTLADENVRPIDDEALAGADVVLASAMIVQRASLERLVERCRRLGTRIVVGGPLVSGCFEELRRDGFDPDTWFLGEAEELFGELVRDLRSGELRRAYAHVPDERRAERVRSVFGREARVHVAPLPSLDGSPLPRFDLIELGRYHSMAVQASRGCPIRCEFCDIWKQYGVKARTGGPARMLEQLDVLASLGWRGRVFVVDDNFIGNVGAASALLGELGAWQLGRRRFRLSDPMRAALGPRRVGRLRRRFRRDRFQFALTTEADVRLGGDGAKMTVLRERMAAAGFRGVFLGIETPSASALEETHKRVNVGRDGDARANLLASVRRIQRAGIEVMSGFILGFDNDPPDIDRRMIDFVEEAGIPVAMVGTLGVLPGTALEERLKREGRYRGRLFGSQTHAFRLNYEPRGRSEARVLQQYADVLAALYGGGMSSYYRRCEIALRRLGQPVVTGDRLGWRELVAFLRSFAAVRPRWAYVRFLGRVLRRRPRHLAHAVVLALQGEHLRRLTAAKLGEYRARRARDVGGAVALSSTDTAWVTGP